MSASSAPRPRAGRILGGLLILASGVLAFLVLRPVPESAVEEPPVVTASPPSSPTPLRAEGALLLAPTVDPTLAAIDRPSLPEEWAETVLDNAIQHLTGVNRLVDAGFASLASTAHGITEKGPDPFIRKTVARPGPIERGRPNSLIQIKVQSFSSVRPTNPGLSSTKGE